MTVEQGMSGRPHAVRRAKPSLRVAVRAAKARMALDEKLGQETPQRIKDLAERGQ